MGRTNSLVEHRLIRIVPCIGGIDIGHHRDGFIGSLHITPTHELLIGLLDEEERGVLEGGTDVLDLCIFLVAETLSFEFLLTAVQQELGLVAQIVGGNLRLLGLEVETLQHIHGSINQRNGLGPVSNVRLYITSYHRGRRTASAALGAHGLLTIENGIVLQFSPRG